jgi:hypothetical protein
MVVRVFNVKDALTQTLTNMDWIVYVRTLQDTQKKLVWIQARDVRKLILSNDLEFRQSSANCCNVIKAPMVVLKEFNDKQFCMEIVYVITRTLLHHVMALHNAPFNMPFHRSITNYPHKEKYTNLHYIGAILNPHLIENSTNIIIKMQ